MAQKLIACIISFGFGILVCAGQESEKAESIPTAVQWTLDAAGPTQRAAIKSVVLLYCPKASTKGTGFVLSDGLIVTNNHVVAGCTAGEMVANPIGGQQFGFLKMATDKDVDLALLKPDKHLTDGLELGADTDPPLGSTVTTWGFPLMFNGPAPLISVGYVAGYVNDGVNGKEVKHIVVNGAFNPGNSGGPLFRGNDNKVIGVVVAKFLTYPPFVANWIQGLVNNKSGLVYTSTDEHGKTVSYSEAQVTALLLDQFYKNTQVMIGEAISVSELRAFINKKKSEIQ